MEWSQILFKIESKSEIRTLSLTNSILSVFFFMFLDIDTDIQEQHQWNYVVESKKSRRKERFQ